MKKKLLSAVLAAAMVLSLAACGKNTPASTETSASTDTTSTDVVASTETSPMHVDCLTASLLTQDTSQLSCTTVTLTVVQKQATMLGPNGSRNRCLSVTM